MHAGVGLYAPRKPNRRYADRQYDAATSDVGNAIRNSTVHLNLMPSSRVYRREARRLREFSESAPLPLRDELSDLACRYDDLAVRAAAEESPNGGAPHP